jgi:hypothetical protein
MKHSECISELYQMLKDISAALDRDNNSAHYKACPFCASPFPSISLYPVTILYPPMF